MLVGAALEQGPCVADEVLQGGVHATATPSDPVAVRYRPRPRAAEGVPGGETGRERRSAEEIRVHHPHGPEDALAEVSVQRQTADVLDDLAQRREAWIAVGECGAWVRYDFESIAVVITQRRQRLTERDAEDRRAGVPGTPTEVEQVPEVTRIRDPGGVGQQMTDRGLPEAIARQISR